MAAIAFQTNANSSAYANTASGACALAADGDLRYYDDSTGLLADGTAIYTDAALTILDTFESDMKQSPVSLKFCNSTKIDLKSGNFLFIILTNFSLGISKFSLGAIMFVIFLYNSCFNNFSSDRSTQSKFIQVNLDFIPSEILLIWFVVNINLTFL